MWQDDSPNLVKHKSRNLETVDLLNREFENHSILLPLIRDHSQLILPRYVSPLLKNETLYLTRDGSSSRKVLPSIRLTKKEVDKAEYLQRKYI